MPVLLIPLALLAALVVVLLAIPLGIVQRYRVGTSRRKARGCMTLVNVAAFSISALLVLTGAAVTSLWVPTALPYTAAGLAGGGLLGWLGLALSRWERTPEGLHVTPCRWLVLVITLLVAARVGYGVWRAWEAWPARAADESWLATAGVAGSLAAGAVVIGYSLVYWLGARRRATRHRPE